MILGIGTDIIRINQITDLNGDTGKPFIEKTYTKEEQAEALKRSSPDVYFATRFAGKEAVFKCLGIAGNDIRLNDIEILNTGTGQPAVMLSGTIKAIADNKGIKRIHISLSYDESYAIAFAVAED